MELVFTLFLASILQIPILRMVIYILKMKKRIQLAALSVLLSFSQQILVYGEQAQQIARPTHGVTTA